MKLLNACSGWCVLAIASMLVICMYKTKISTDGKLSLGLTVSNTLWTQAAVLGTIIATVFLAMQLPVAHVSTWSADGLTMRYVHTTPDF